MINRKGFKRRRSWPNRIIIPEFTWRNWRNHKKPIRSFRVRAEIRAGNIPASNL